MVEPTTTLEHVSMGRLLWRQMLRRAVLRPVYGVLMLLLGILLGCGDVESQGTAGPTSSPLEASPIPTLGVSRQTLEHAFEGIGFPSFMGHGAAELVSSSLPVSVAGSLPNIFVPITAEIYGPPQDVEAVEVQMSLSTNMSVGSVVLLTLMDTVSPDWAERDAWLGRAIKDLAQQDTVVTREGGRLYTLRSIAFPESLFFSVEGVAGGGAN